MQDDFGLMQIKTPVIQIPDEKNSIYVKRDDLLPFSFGGNKVRWCCLVMPNFIIARKQM